ncbi:acyl-CoA dehydrogenase family protein [Streptomyces sp. Wb2n-11]|uniref:acyl-CoA dehydrogenase family protein n=1 Tax=Streptomyces sp. Wb2n-11 TaxID=1030533 RepID=UPI000B07BA32|nr:acyl-CoA dehydrogenase family protein [Streptomyces sp. Wb2n-11]
MATHHRDRAVTADLRDPRTSSGGALLDLLTGHLPRMRDGARQHDRDGTFPVEAFEGLRTSGVLGATVPTELGGLGVASLHDVALALATVAEADASTALALHMQLSRGLTLTHEWLYADDRARALAERLLRGMGSGEAVVCTTVKDAGGGRVVTRLRPAPDGGWLLSGRKTLASMAPIATDFVISARVDVAGVTRSAAAVLPRWTPGLTVLDNWDGLGMRASGSVDILLEDCPIGVEDVFLRGPVGEVNDAALAGQTVSSITMLGIYVGVAQAARDLVVSELTRRGGLPSAGVRTLLAEIESRLYALRTTVGGTLSVADHLAYEFDGDPVERGRRMMFDFQRAKLMVNRLAPEIVSDSLSVIGGASYSGSHPLARLYRDVRAGAFMHPFTYPDAVDWLSHATLGGAKE